ncbi:putative glycosyltransferase 6 domain-containing protein 1 isoform X2 [Fukomys damarensis]|uniref:putative glycosyltransferase 6 domain-containing protein 1 isoform X2 n=1 Tax=Fukomys damarensis TaxID=885580 RepID=UPI0005403682|nr:putative glycosyltransferase 6 domain-containing protein 1 isoform X2 [Fukomys damarensis]
MNSKKRMLLLISFILTLLMAQHYFRSGQERELQLSEWFKPRRRPDILTVTSWLAPVLWEGTFSRQALQRHYRGRNLTVGLVVFAPTRSADGHLERFLRSAITHFMPGQRVVFYLILDSFVDPPDMQPSPLQSFQILMVGERWWWPDLDLMGLQVLREHLLGHITDEVDFLFSTASNLVFQGDFGLETLGTSVAQLHAWWYFQNNQSFPYERRPSSAAYIPFGQGDFYYGSAIVGGLPRQAQQAAVPRVWLGRQVQPASPGAVCQGGSGPQGRLRAAPTGGAVWSRPLLRD